MDSQTTSPFIESKTSPSAPKTFPMGLLILILSILVIVLLVILLSLLITPNQASLSSDVSISSEITVSPTIILPTKGSEDWQDYTNEKLFFSLRYPSSWQSEEIPQGISIQGISIQQNLLGGVMLSNVPTNSYNFGDGQKAVWVFAVQTDKEKSLNQWASEAIASNITVLNKEIITINGNSALRIDQKISSSAEQNQFTYYFFKKDSLGWGIYTVYRSGEEENTEFDQIASTFQILPTDSFVETVEMLGASMEPKFKNGMRYAIDRNAYITKKPNRWDIVFIELPDKPDIQVIKRIVGLPGETITIEGGKVYINSTPIDEPYLFEHSSTVIYNPSVIKEGKAFFIGKDQYFVMGDNRAHSSDSREWGSVNMKDIRAKILL